MGKWYPSARGSRNADAGCDGIVDARAKALDKARRDDALDVTRGLRHLTDALQSSIFIVDTIWRQTMKTRVQKWGNSLALRIPKSFADEVGLQRETSVEVSLDGGKLVITPVSRPELTLEQLLAEVTEDNLHQEVDTGTAVGNEAW
jgi:antitoxin MazE